MNEVALNTIIADSDCQLRAAGSKATVLEYAEALAAGATFPPVIVFRDEDGRHWLADGFHRLEAHRLAGRETIIADVHAGGQRDARLHAAGANANHGLRRSHDDKRKAILALLHDPEWRKWSDRKIAEATSTDHKTVGKLRREISGEAASGEIPTRRTQATRNVELVDKPAAGLVERVLAGLPDDVLLGEVRRRGLVEGAR